MKIGTYYLQDRKCEFSLWAPFLKEVALKIVFPEEVIIPMKKQKHGYWSICFNKIFPGARYLYRFDEAIERPDPASNFQPEGIHGPSEVIDHSSFCWEDNNWCGISLKDMVIYELHVGSFTPEGTFEAIIGRLDALLELGINTINIMPVAQFSGKRNWGYDGVYPFAIHSSYGRPEGFKKLVNACHRHGIAVMLDVVYNHLGPEGNYLEEFGPYFTEKYKTPWGKAINFDDAYSDAVREFFIENALFWFRHYHIDALRLDAIHAIYDMSANHFLLELAERVKDFSKKVRRKFYLIAESNLNDVRVIRPKELGGYGLDAQWCDDFHHSLHALLTDEKTGYYIDFGEIKHLVKAFKEGFVYSWQYSTYRKRHHGSSSKDRPSYQFIIFSQNHDQVGNRMLGERLSKLVSFEGLKLAAGAVIFSPYIPLLFMGEEYGEEVPFTYFVNHSDQDLIAAVREGRKKEFKAFKWQKEPLDPQDPKTFLQSKLKWGKRKEGKHKVMLEFYCQLIKLRKQNLTLKNLGKKTFKVLGIKEQKLILLHRWYNKNQVFMIMNFNQKDSHFIVPKGKWKKLIDSSEKKWMGPGSLLPKEIEEQKELNISPLSFALYEWR